MKREPLDTSPGTSTNDALDSLWESAAMRTLAVDMAFAIDSDSSVMISGENGAGRKVVARAIHQRSRRASGPFVIAHCRERAEPSMASGWGCDPGPLFTDSLFRAAGHGTLVIDEIETMPSTFQQRLLQLVETERTSGDGRRVMTVAGGDLFSRVRSQEFRSDLFYRLNVIHLRVPALRDRPEDIPILFLHYLSSHASIRVPRLSTAAEQQLVAYPWPGNLPELQAVARSLAEQNLERRIEAEDLPFAMPL
jgi:two-component system response regulator AtoC